MSKMICDMKRKVLFVPVILILISFVSCSSINTNSSFNTYVDNLEMVSGQMINDCAEAETICNLVIKVWSNAIYETSDPETDKYTKVDNQFVDDFNIAVANIYADPDIGVKLSTLESNQAEIQLIIKDMFNPPAELEQCYNTLSEFYVAYKAYVNLALNPTGSLTTFSEEFNEKGNTALELYEMLSIQIPNKK